MGYGVCLCGVFFVFVLDSFFFLGGGVMGMK